MLDGDYKTYQGQRFVMAGEALEGGSAVILSLYDSNEQWMWTFSERDVFSLHNETKGLAVCELMNWERHSFIGESLFFKQWLRPLI